MTSYVIFYNIGGYACDISVKTYELIGHVNTDGSTLVVKISQ